jgi:hypothetical protein
MTDIPNASRGVRLALLEGQLLSRQFDRHVFLEGQCGSAPGFACVPSST